MDKNLKEQAEDLFADLGLSFTAAVTAFTKQAVREQRIPFSLSRDIPNTETAKSIYNIENNRNLSKEFSSVAELMEDLYAED
jgi:DNA-damage-inducible protein J